MNARTFCSLFLLAVHFTLGLLVSRHPEDADEPSTDVERIDPPVRQPGDTW